MLCTLIVSQMLPEAVAVKGGMGIKLRMGETGTRATSDLDVSSGQRGVDFEESFREQLAQGWGEVPPPKELCAKTPVPQTAWPLPPRLSHRSYTTRA